MRAKRAERQEKKVFKIYGFRETDLASGLAHSGPTFLSSGDVALPLRPMLRSVQNATASGDVVLHIPQAWVVPICVGAGLLLLLIVATAVWCCCRCRRRRRSANERESELAHSLLHGALAPVAEGWFHKNRPATGLKRESWKRRYCVMFGHSTMAYLKNTIYYFAAAEEARLFYQPGEHRRPKPKGSVSLAEVIMVRRSGRTNLPENSAGIELHVQGRVWLLATRDEDQFDTWTGAISHATGKPLRAPPGSSRKKKTSKKGKLSSAGRKRRHSRADSAASDLDVSDASEGEWTSSAGAAANSETGTVAAGGNNEHGAPKTLPGHSPSSSIGSAVTGFFTGLKRQVSRRGDDFVHSTRDTKELDDGSFSFYLTKGWIYKRGRTNTSWKKRWFEHQNGVLQYFTKEGGKLKGEMVVKGCTIETVGNDGFRVVAENRVLHCRCDEEEDAANWVSLLEQVAE